MTAERRCSVWVDTRETSAVGWFRIADDVPYGVATELLLTLSVPAEILAAHVTGAEAARSLPAAGLTLVVEFDIDAPENEQGMVHAAGCRSVIGSATIGRATYLDEVPGLVAVFYGYDDGEKRRRVVGHLEGLRYHAACVKLPRKPVQS